MKLTYRGTQYYHEATPTEMVDSGLMGAYRGQAFSVTYPRHMSAPQTLRELTYRGAAYRSTPTGEQVTVAAKAPVAAKRPTPSYLKPTARSSEYNQTHQLYIRRRLQQRIEAAKARGDYKLLNLLESEMQQAG